MLHASGTTPWFETRPIVGLITFGVVMLTYFGRVRFKGRLPGGGAFGAAKSSPSPCGPTAKTRSA